MVPEAGNSHETINEIFRPLKPDIPKSPILNFTDLPKLCVHLIKVCLYPSSFSKSVGFSIDGF
jgi:hypothetical protein